MIQKCVCKDCESRGEPQEGFDFFCCENCLAELAFWLDFLAMQKQCGNEAKN